MMESQGNDTKHIKVCLLGGERVGKSHLAHRLTDRQYLEYAQTKEYQTFLKADETIAYYDYPSFHEKMAEELPRDHKFDIMICIFKDSTNFGQLYEFLEAITNKSNENDEEYNSYWERIKMIVLVYSNYQEKGKVQIEQLFGILSQQVRNFNRSGTIKEFVLKKDFQNSQQLHEIIYSNKYGNTCERQAPKVEEQQLKDRLKLARSKRFSYIKDNFTFKSRDFSKSFNVEVEAQEKNEEYLPDHQYVEITEVKQQQKRQEHQKQAVEQAHQVEQVLQLPNSIISNHVELQQEDPNINKEKEQPSQLNVENHKNEANIKVQVVENEPLAIQLRIQEQSNRHEKQKEHYSNIMNKLLEKINKEQIQPSKKTAYQELLEQFRKATKDDSKISQQMHSYWIQRLNKVEQQNSVEDQDRFQNQRIDSHNAAAQSNQIQQVVREQQKPLNPQSQRLPPPSNILSGEMPRRQKQAKVDSQSCACIIM